MNKHFLIKYFCGILLFFATTGLFAQNPVSFSGSMNISTGWNYQTSTVTGGVDNYWNILFATGNTVIPPQVRNAASGSWVATTNAAQYEWLNTGGQDEGYYYYRFAFCVNSAAQLNQLTGQLAADNQIMSIRLDGQTLVDFSNASICPGYSFRIYDFECYKNFSAAIPGSALTNGYHLMEFEVYNQGDVTGLIVNASLAGISGSVLPANWTNSSVPVVVSGDNFRTETTSPNTIINPVITGCAVKGLIRGIVFEDKNQNKAHDLGSEATMANVSVSLLDLSGNVVQTTTSDAASGAYNFYGVDMSKDYKIVCNYVAPYIETTPVSPAYFPIHFDGTNTIIANQDFGLYKSTIKKDTIIGTVFYDANQNALKDAGESVLAGYVVQLYDQSNTLIQSVTTAADGRYMLIANSLQTYTVKITAHAGDLVTTPNGGQYVLQLTQNFDNKNFGIYLFSCTDCVTSFSPIPGQTYFVSAWVKETFDVTATPPVTYVHSGVKINFNNGSITTVPLFRPSGPVVEGWQRIEGTFAVPASAQNIEIVLVNENAAYDIFFDDVRIHPLNSNMKSFVYNPSTQKLVAELDENNFATIYEYDDEGILIRVKKETERGVMTIKETRSNQSKVQTNKATD